MLQVGCDSIRSLSIQCESEIRTALTVLSTSKNIKVVILDVELIVNRIGGVPSPTSTYLIMSLVCGTHVTLIVNLINRQIGTPCPAALVVANLSTIGQALDRLNLYETYSIQAIANALVVGTLTVYQT